MCLNKHWIINPLGKRLLVKCGKCPACMQEKANRRTRRIRQQFEDGFVPLFVTLTYSNKFVPYFLLDDLLYSPLLSNLNFSSYKEKGLCSTDRNILNGFAATANSFSCRHARRFRQIQIYRGSSVRWVRNKDSIRKKVVSEVDELDVIDIPENSEKSYFKPLQKLEGFKIGVCYYKDLSDFIKRLRYVLQENFKIYDHITFYACSEYGPTTCRPHFHLLLWCKYSDIFKYKVAISKAWPFDNYGLTYKNISIAKNAASYVSSYVNCDTTIPTLFKEHSQLRPHHSFSKGFGLSLRAFQIPQIYEAFKRGDLHYICQRVRNGALVNDSVLLPKYVISRVFPKFKGYTRLNVNEIFSLCFRPSDVSNYRNRLDLFDDDVTNIERTIINKRRLFCSFGYSTYEFADIYSRIWQVYSQNVLRDFYESFNSIPFIKQLEAYDNIKDLFTGDVLNNLDTILFNCPPGYHIESDPNLFEANRLEDYSLSSMYHTKSKDKKIRNYIYSQKINV